MLGIPYIKLGTATAHVTVLLAFHYQSSCWLGKLQRDPTTLGGCAGCIREDGHLRSANSALRRWKMPEYWGRERKEIADNVQERTSGVPWIGWDVTWISIP